MRAKSILHIPRRCTCSHSTTSLLQILPQPPPPPQMLLSDNLTVIEALAAVCKDHHAELACNLIQIFCHYNRVLPIVNACLAKSIEKEGKTSSTICVLLLHGVCDTVRVCVCVRTCLLVCACVRVTVCATVCVSPQTMWQRCLEPVRWPQCSWTS